MIDDATYVRELLAILTNPQPSGISPTDPYGMSDDGIDRYDGFGREVWVESLRVTDDGPWKELEVTFGLDVPGDPAFREVPSSGTVRFPFGADWRELSRYAEPYLIYQDHDFGRSIREELPGVRGGVEVVRRIAQIRATNPAAQSGWFANSTDGKSS